MAIMLGKRKRKPQEPIEAKEEDVSRSPPPALEDEDVQAIFRHHFEAQFKPLGEVKKPRQRTPETPLSKAIEEESDWSGFSGEEEEEDVVEVIEHSTTAEIGEAVSKHELKAFMVSSTSALRMSTVLMPT